MEEQKQVFLKLFGNRLDRDELNSDYWAGVLEKKDNAHPAETALKKVRSTGKAVGKIVARLQNIDPGVANKIDNHFAEIEKLLEGIR